ncbi:hypothetical protein [Streptomyces sp. NPDC001970]
MISFRGYAVSSVGRTPSSVSDSLGWRRALGVSDLALPDQLVEIGAVVCLDVTH